MKKKSSINLPILNGHLKLVWKIQQLKYMLENVLIIIDINQKDFYFIDMFSSISSSTTI